MIGGRAVIIGAIAVVGVAWWSAPQAEKARVVPAPSVDESASQVTSHDPTPLDRQGPDVGTQYRSSGSFLISIARRQRSLEERDNGATRATIRRAVQCIIR